MKKNENENLMQDKILLAATLYYKNHLSQQEIAKRLNVSRPWVSKLLSKACDLGIVKVHINSPISGNPLLETRLKDMYGLSHARVISKTQTSKDYIALAAVNYFISQIRPKDIIGIGWGNAVSRFIRELIPLHMPDTQTVPLAGSFGTTFETLPNYSSIQLAQKLEGTANVLHAPAFCSSREEYETLISNRATREILSMAEQADIIITGIGTFISSFLTRYHILSGADIQKLKNADAIGDIAMQFLSHDGRPVDTELTRHLIKADIFKAKKHARTVLSIAEGTEKTEIIHTVLSLHLVDAFFTSEETALALLHPQKPDSKNQ